MVKTIPALGIPWRSSGYDSAFTAKGSGSVPGWGTKIPYDAHQILKKKKKGEHLIPVIFFPLNLSMTLAITDILLLT